MKRWLNRSHLEKGGDLRSNDGYTIVETLIVLAVTSMMFAAIVVSFNGRQARVEFSQAVRDYESMMQNIMSDVSKGYYSSEGYECYIDSGNHYKPTLKERLIPANNTTGTNGDCIFMGKILEPNGKSNFVHTIIGSRFAFTYNPSSPNDSDAQNLGFIYQLAQDSESGDTRVATASELKSQVVNSFQLNVVKVVAAEPPYSEIKLMVFTNYIATMNITDVSRSTSVIYFRENFIDSFGNIDRDKVFAGFANEQATKLASVNGAIICLQGQNGQYAEINIGSGDLSANISSTLDTKPSVGDPCYVSS